MIKGDVEYSGLNDKALTVLMDIQERDGALAPERVVEAAVSAESPLHSMFEWDDDVAAEQYRLTQARGIIQRVTVHVRSAPTILTRAFVSVQRSDVKRYELVTGGPEIIERRRLQLVSDLARLQERMAEFQEFAQAAALMTEVVAALG